MSNPPAGSRGGSGAEEMARSAGALPPGLPDYDRYSDGWPPWPWTPHGPSAP